MNVPVQLVRYDITATEPSYINYIQSQKDNDVRKFRVKFFAENTEISLTNCTATATITIDNIMIEQELACTITDNSVEVTANATRDGVMAIQITLTDGDNKLTMQRPIFVRVTNDIAETAQIDDDSHGSYAEVVQEIADARGTHTTLHDAIENLETTLHDAIENLETTLHDAIENLETIPYSVKLAMDTLFSKAAYADDDAASSYATFHAWAMFFNVTGDPLTVQPNITYVYDSGNLAASENVAATSLISIDDTSITHTVSAAVNGVGVNILLRVFDQNGLAFNSSGLAKSQTIPAKDYKCFGVILTQALTSDDVVTVTVDGAQKQASYGTLEGYSNTVPVDIQVGGIDGTTGEIIENSARLITGFIDVVPGLFSESMSGTQLLLTAPSGVWVKVFEYSDSSFLQYSSIGTLTSNQARGNPASACTKFRVLFKKGDGSDFTSADIESLTLNNHDIVTYEFTEVNRNGNL